MISLPPGCSVSYNVTIDVTELNSEMIDWYQLIGGWVTYDEWYDFKGRKRTRVLVSYNEYKFCHYGNNTVRLHFLGKDAAVASMFLLKFMDKVYKHNLKEHEELQIG